MIKKTSNRRKTDTLEGVKRLYDVMKKLRAPDGCPWDKIQTLETLKPCVLEETYELLAAMDHPEKKDNYIEELGDVLLQVVFQCVMAEEKRRFSFNDVANAIADKLIRRHPHVFGDVTAKDATTVLKNWEMIKQKEHKKNKRHSAIDGVPSVLPGLLKAQRTQEKAARVGFDWKDSSGPLEKIKEELLEVKESVENCKNLRKKKNFLSTKQYLHMKEEIGDLLFAITNYARHVKVDAESALELTTAKFSRRFRAVESMAKTKKKTLKDCTLEEMESYWQKVKSCEN